MLKDAKKLDSHDYIVSDGKICYKEFDGLTSRTVYGYSTAFAAMKEHENGRVTDDHLEYRLGISLDCGESSYAELPNCSFDGYPVLASVGVVRMTRPTASPSG